MESTTDRITGCQKSETVAGKLFAADAWLIARGYLFIFFAALYICLIGCRDDHDVRPVFDKKRNHSWMSLGLEEKESIAQITNMGNNTNQQQVFEVKKGGQFLVFAVGEFEDSFMQVDPRYYFKGDDIELFFKVRQSVKPLILPWSAMRGKNGHQALSYINHAHVTSMVIKGNNGYNYYSKISLPWSFFEIDRPGKNTTLPFEIAIGDCDDAIKQKAKIAWHNQHFDPINHGLDIFGSLLLTGKNQKTSSNKRDTLASLYTETRPDLAEERSRALAAQEIEHCVAGAVRDKNDLSARVSSCWTKDSLYLFVTIKDDFLERIDLKAIKKQQYFVDYGWIERENGEKVWEMNALNAQFAGGAYKNQKVSAMLYLKRGRYHLRYVTNKSHSYNNWNAAMPETPFYGIVVYKL